MIIKSKIVDLYCRKLWEFDGVGGLDIYCVLFVLFDIFDLEFDGFDGDFEF